MIAGVARRNGVYKESHYETTDGDIVSQERGNEALPSITISIALNFCEGVVAANDVRRHAF